MSQLLCKKNEYGDNISQTRNTNQSSILFEEPIIHHQARIHSNLLIVVLKDSGDDAHNSCDHIARNARKTRPSIQLLETMLYCWTTHIWTIKKCVYQNPSSDFSKIQQTTVTNVQQQRNLPIPNQSSPNQSLPIARNVLQISPAKFRWYVMGGRWNICPP